VCEKVYPACVLFVVGILELLRLLGLKCSLHAIPSLFLSFTEKSTQREKEDKGKKKKRSYSAVVSYLCEVIVYCCFSYVAVCDGGVDDRSLSLNSNRLPLSSISITQGPLRQILWTRHRHACACPYSHAWPGCPDTNLITTTYDEAQSHTSTCSVGNVGKGLASSKFFLFYCYCEFLYVYVYVYVEL
jgi:hypothetical protein